MLPFLLDEMVKDRSFICYFLKFEQSYIVPDHNTHVHEKQFAKTIFCRKAQNCSATQPLSVHALFVNYNLVKMTIRVYHLHRHTRAFEEASRTALNPSAGRRLATQTF